LYELGPAQFGIAVEEQADASQRKVFGCWAFEKSLRSKMREELKKDDPAVNSEGPPVQMNITPSEDVSEEIDSYDREWCRHMVGRSA
jgi:hypothetical protein